MTVAPDKIATARDDLDAHVRAIVEWHFSPETGCPFWLSYAQQLNFDPREKIHSYDDLALLGHFEDEWLRGGPVRQWVPKAYADEPIYVFRDRRLDRLAQIPYQHPRLPHRLRALQREPVRGGFSQRSRLANAWAFGAAPPAPRHRIPSPSYAAACALWWISTRAGSTNSSPRRQDARLGSLQSPRHRAGAQDPQGPRQRAVRLHHAPPPRSPLRKKSPCPSSALRASSAAARK